MLEIYYIFLCKSLLEIVGDPCFYCCILYSEHSLPSRDRSRRQITPRKLNWKECQRLALCCIQTSAGNVSLDDCPQACWLGSELGQTCILWMLLSASSLAKQCGKETEGHLRSFGGSWPHSSKPETAQWAVFLPVRAKLTQMWSRTVLRNLI